MTETVAGVLHPGEMGAAVAACLTGRGLPVLWASAGRGHQTAGRARAAGLSDRGTTAEMVKRADVILSICPPHAALEVARAVAGFGGLYVDANAISPATAREVAREIEDGGGCYVDGGIIGSPPRSPGSTRLYLSGGRAGEVRGLFEGTYLDARVLDGAFTASALKMSYASWTKGTAALILAARALAQAEGVEQDLLREWALSQPGLADRWESAARSAAAKGWRWVAEMEEIAAAMTDAGQPGGFHQAAAQVFARSPRPGQRDGEPPASVSQT